MSKEVFQLVGEMDREDLQTQLALQCAPLLMGIKMSNLLIVPNRNVLDVYELFKDTCISVELITCQNRRQCFYSTAGKNWIFILSQQRRKRSWNFSDTGE